MTLIPFPAVAGMVFTERSVSLSTTNVILSPVKTEALAQTAWGLTAAPVLWDTVDRTVR